MQGPYVYPCFTATCVWTRVKGAARVVLANPNSGPGTKQDTKWVRLTEEMRAAGTLALGYVYTSSGSRSAATIKSEISKYYQLYPSLAGIFIDQVRCKQQAAQGCRVCNWSEHATALEAVLQEHQAQVQDLEQHGLHRSHTCAGVALSRAARPPGCRAAP